MEKEPIKKITVVGIVTSNKMKDTITVKRELPTTHDKFKKTVTTVSKFKAHDAGNTCKPGDKVRIQFTRPLSKTKCWKLVEIIEKAK